MMQMMACLNAAIRLSIIVTGAVMATLPASAKGLFDGAWDTVVSCENAAGALGYSFRFPSVIKDGVLHGQKGSKGKPGWFQIDGSIAADGTARLYADGLVGAAEVAVGGRPAGTRYGYHVDANFKDDSGAGKRVEGRTCSLEFKKQ
jgi:hypothetical protein